MKQNIGIIGYGKLGHALAQRAEETGYKVLASEDKKDNWKIAKESRIVVLCTKPDKIAEVSTQIIDHVSAADIISFAAAVPVERFRELFGKDVQRAMTNLRFDAVIHTNKNEKINKFCRDLSRTKAIGVEDDSRIDLSTVGVGCLPGIAAWAYKNYPEAADVWLAQWANFFRSEIGVDRSVFTKIINDVRTGNDYDAIIREVATAGGITEAMILELGKNPWIDLRDLIGVAMDKTQDIAKKV